MKSFNYIIASIISQFNLGLVRKVRFIKIVKSPIAIKIFRILYLQGVIRTIKIQDEYILVYYKYILGNSICKVSIVSKPSNRCYWTLNKLSLKFNNNNFSGFYIISTPKGLVTSNYCLLDGRISGEVLIKVEI